MYTELENEYKDKINFQLVNVDENPEALENFSLVKDQTPALLCLIHQTIFRLLNLSAVIKTS